MGRRKAKKRKPLGVKVEKNEIKLRARIAELEKALRPFADLQIEGHGSAIWMYQGNDDQTRKSDLRVAHIVRAREVLEL